VIEIADREFPLVVMRDGMSRWDDHTERRKIRQPCHQNLELQAFAGNQQALHQIENELLEFTLSVAVPWKVFLKVLEIV